MSDDDQWADDAGGGDDWNDDADGAKGGSGAADDDGWGSGADDGGGNEDDEMMMDSNNINSDDGNRINSSGGSDDVDIQIANLFYEAEDLMRAEPAAALVKFQAVVALVRDRAIAATASSSNITYSVNDESRTSFFQSMLHIVTTQYKLHAYDAMIADYQLLLAYIPQVTRNEASDAVDTVLNCIHSASSNNSNSNSSDSAADDKRNAQLLQTLYTITRDTLSGIPDTDRIVFFINMKLCRTYQQSGALGDARRVLRELHAECRDAATGADDRKNKASELLEIYALQIQIDSGDSSSNSNSSSNLKQVYENTKHLTSAVVKDPRSMSVIRECWGKMFGEEGQWQRAYAEFYSAFQSYQEIGYRDAAKTCLLYVVVSNMLAGGEQNVFDAREAKVYQGERDVQAIGSLRAAYEKVDVVAFHDALTEINNSGDAFIRTHLTSMIVDFQSRAVVSMVRAYRCVTLVSLASQLHVSVSEVEAVVVQLLLDGELHGSIDQRDGSLNMTTTDTLEAVKQSSLQRYLASVSSVSQELSRPAAWNSTY